MTLKNSLHLSPTICSDAKKSDDVTKGDYVINVNEPNIIIDDVIEIFCYFVKKLVALEGNLYFTVSRNLCFELLLLLLLVIVVLKISLWLLLLLASVIL